PVNYDVWHGELGPLIGQVRPDAIVSFGLSAKATGFTLESTARNRMSRDRPDINGVYPRSEKISEQGREIYPTRLPLSDIAAALTRLKLPIARSDDAGDYLCNMLFYRVMALAEATGAPRMGGFIHLPYLDVQRARLAASGLPVEGLVAMTEE